MRRSHLSVSGFSVFLAMALALWEIYFFFAGGSGRLEGTLGLFTSERLGFNMAWLILIYMSYQLVSIPFALPSAGARFIGIVDGMASLVPLVIVLVVLFGKSELLNTPGRWEAALLLAGVSLADLFGGYAFNIALSRRIFDIGGAGPTS
jgi:membrane-bound ClpP family serine protease